MDNETRTRDHFRIRFAQDLTEENEKTAKPLWLSGLFGGDEENRTPLDLSTSGQNVRHSWTLPVVDQLLSISCGLNLTKILTISEVDDLSCTTIITR